MKYRVVIRAFTLRRDLVWGYILKGILESMGCEVFIACCRNFELAVRHWKPHAVVLNTLGSISQARSCSPDTLVFVWHAEGVAEAKYDISADLGTEDFSNEYDMVEKFFLWGRHAEKFFDSKFPDSPKKMIVGSPRLDAVKFYPYGDFTIGEKDKTIGLLGSFPIINDYAGRPAIRHIYNIEDGLDYVKLQCEKFSRMVKVIEHIMEKTSFRVSYRPHPVEAPEGWDFMKKKYGERFIVNEDYDIASWLLKQKFIISPGSSGFMEAYLLKIPIICIDRIGMDNFEEPSFIAQNSYDTTYHPGSMDKLFEMIEKSPEPKTNVPQVEKMLTEAHDWDSERSDNLKAAHEIVKTLKEKSPARGLFSRTPRTLIDLIDWGKFLKATYMGSRLHPNFNYKSGYHKIPSFYNKMVCNILDNKPQYRKYFS